MTPGEGLDFDNLRRLFGGARARDILAAAREAARRAADSPAADGTGSHHTTTVPHGDAVVFGVFVSLHLHGELRGCMGTLGRPGAFGALLGDAARSVVRNDPRFETVRPDELAACVLEVSVMTPFEWLDLAQLPEAIRVGVDGLVVESGRHRGLLLPQVAVKHGMSATVFLEETCLKAGLRRDAWRHDARVARFRAVVLSEGDE